MKVIQDPIVNVVSGEQDMSPCSKVSQREYFNVSKFWLFWSQELDPAPGSYSWIPYLSNHREFQKNAI